jgi:hypothetical protein
MPVLKPENVPVNLIPLVPVAEKWGIGDDFEREQAISAASVEELDSLVRSIDGIADEDFYGWLSGPESFNKTPSPEYVAMSNLAMAIDSARSKIRKIKGGQKGHD